MVPKISGVNYERRGFISFMNPVAGIIAVTTLCGILLVFQGIGFIINALFSGRFMRP